MYMNLFNSYELLRRMMMKRERIRDVGARKHNGSLTNKHNGFDSVRVMGREYGATIYRR
jgi:hypothetical protein